MPEKILINFPTNIGDTILALPVVNAIKTYYPQSLIIAISSVKNEELLSRNSFINDNLLFDKRWSLRRKMKFALSLRGRYHIFIDLKNTALPFVVGANQRTGFLRNFKKSTHLKDRYLQLIKKFKRPGVIKKADIVITPQERDKWKKKNIPESVFVSCSSRSQAKRYNPDYLGKVIDRIKDKHRIVLLGEAHERDFYNGVFSKKGVIDLVGKTSIQDIFYLLENYAKLLLSVDSAILHIASYLDVPVVSLFGPTSSENYGPYSAKSIVLRRENFFCPGCVKSKCRFEFGCMKIAPDRVAEAVTRVI